ncbi:MAG: 50S ribosomal protein L32 [Clostridiales bacterium]|nr:MAG: 50S ribosomal protein L32 [Clostridiales bacterium]
MIAPKRRISKQRKHKRRSSVWKLDMPGMVKCSHCGEYTLSHRVCKHCGYYDGKEIIKIEAKKANA